MTALAFEKTQPAESWQNPGAVQWNRVSVRNVDQPWLLAVLQSLARLSRLPRDWDRYGSPPVQRAALEAASALVNGIENFSLPTPTVCPVTGGGIGFTWQFDSRELEIEILPDGAARYLAVLTDPDTGGEATQEGGFSPDQPEHGQQLAAWLIGS